MVEREELDAGVHYVNVSTRRGLDRGIRCIQDSLAISASRNRPFITMLALSLPALGQLELQSQLPNHVPGIMYVRDLNAPSICPIEEAFWRTKSEYMLSQWGGERETVSGM